MIQIITYSLIGAIVGVWAFLFTGPLSESGQVFGWLKSLIYRNLPGWLYMPLIGCAKCNAFWWGAAVIYDIGQVHFEVLILAVFTAYKLEQNA